MRIILASKSPRRKELLEKQGFEVVVDVSNVDEDSVLRDNVTELVMTLAKLKADVVAKRHKNSVVIAADTLVYFKGKEIGQQKSDAAAKKTLKRLMGNTHEVYTGIYIVNTKTNHSLHDYDISKVTLKNVSNNVLQDYIKSGQYKGKAGAYNIADPEFESFIEKVEGSYTNILGLPVEKVLGMIDSLK
ncbi:MAG: Maf family protein [Nanoarchaeota archaeon]|nr:Maf family protein [Nanoarchaeota archaeon]